MAGTARFFLGPISGFSEMESTLNSRCIINRIFCSMPERRAITHSNSEGQFDGNFEATSHLSFRGRASVFYLSGIFEPSTNTEIMSSLGPPSSLNQTVFTPLTREHGYGARLDTTYEFSSRASLSVFGGSSAIYFDQQAPTATTLLDTQVQTAGVIYGYRLSRYDTVGLTYLLSYYEFGPNGRTLVHNPFFSYTRQFSPNLSARIYGGPAYLRSNNELNSATGVSVVQITNYRNEWNWTLGGDLNLHLQNTAFQVGAQRQVSDGGGLLTTVLSSSSDGFHKTQIDEATRRRLEWQLRAQ